MYIERLKERPINFLLDELKKKNPNVMVIGPIDYSPAKFKSELDKFGAKNIVIDVLGLLKLLIQRFIKRKNYSKDFSPENVYNTKPLRKI